MDERRAHGIHAHSPFLHYLNVLGPVSHRLDDRLEISTNDMEYPGVAAVLMASIEMLIIHVMVTISHLSIIAGTLGLQVRMPPATTG